MTIKVGDRIPSATLGRMTADGPGEVSTEAVRPVVPVGARVTPARTRPVPSPRQRATRPKSWSGGPGEATDRRAPNGSGKATGRSKT